MTFLNKNKHQSRDSPQQTGDVLVAPLKIKKKLRIGFGRKPKKEQNEETRAPLDTSKVTREPSPLLPSLSPNDIEKPFDKNDMLVEDLTLNNEKMESLLEDETGEESHPLASKRKVFMQKDMKGKQVYLEDTGEILGIVYDMVFDADKNLRGYKVKDCKSDAILNFPLDQFDEDKNGLIFIPSWYTTGVKIVEKLEFKDRITPELIWLITDKTVTGEELYDIFVKHDDKIAHYIDEAVALRELITSRLNILEKERVSLKETLMDLTEKRLIKDIDRRQFSEDVMNHRRKVNVLDINIGKCKDLLERLERTSFGMLSKTMTTTNERRNDEGPLHRITLPPSEPGLQGSKNDSYIEKYIDLKQRYDRLLETHNDLKTAVEKLLMKNE
jgi:sporulation protein YlmC with PRC-barrel domain